jgi:hypothetical protein
VLDSVDELAGVVAAAASTPLTLFDEEEDVRRIDEEKEEDEGRVEREEEGVETASTPETLYWV